MRKPNLFIVGAPKCGTTSLAAYLGAHPKCFLPKVKEPHYLSRGLPEPNPSHLKTLEEYESLYRYANEETYLIDASVWYYINRETAFNIKEYSKNGKIIFLIRYPFDAIRSLFSHRFYAGNEDLKNLSLALLCESYRREGFLHPQKLNNTAQGLMYSNNYFYYQRISNYVQAFGRDNVKIIVFDDLKNDSFETMSDICDFLKIDMLEDVNALKKVYNPSKNNRSSIYQGIVSLIPTPMKAILQKSGFQKPVQSLLSFGSKITLDTSIVPIILTNLHKEYIKDWQAIQQDFGIDLSDWEKRMVL